jgi:hypothetical protein
MEMAQRLKSTDGGLDSAYKVYIEFGDYRASDGLRFPRLVTGVTEEGNLDFHVQNIRTNVPVEDSRFQ